VALVLANVQLGRIPADIVAGVLAFFTGVMLPQASKDNLTKHRYAAIFVWTSCAAVLVFTLAKGPTSCTWTSAYDKLTFKSYGAGPQAESLALGELSLDKKQVNYLKAMCPLQTAKKNLNN
jgi:hypothetical protein